MSDAPVNPIGSCFDSAALMLLVPDTPKDARLCHGIGIANMPGQEGDRIGHAWIEIDGDAFDTTWCVRVDAGCYRAQLQLEYVIEYSRTQAIELWLRTDYPGPWDERILAITDAP